MLGVVGGLGSVAFVKLLLGLRAWFMRLPKWTVWFQPVAGGLTVGLMGYFVPEVMGVGYNHVEKVLNGDIVLKLVVLFAVLKIVATAVCYASGNAGGIFGPSLFIGAMMGAAVGGVAHTLFPAYTAGPGAYALVGMGTAFAGIVRTPLTSVIMIFEITRDYTIIVPLMISNLIAFFISHKLQEEPIYEALASPGRRAPAHRASRCGGASGFRYARRCAPAPAVLSPDLPLAAAARPDEGRRVRCLARRRRGRAVGNGPDQRDRAVPRRRERSNQEGRGDSPRRLPARRLHAEELPHVHPDHSLSLALERMGTSGLNVLPVVSRANVRQLLGIVVLDDILDAYGVAKRDRSTCGAQANNGKSTRADGLSWEPSCWSSSQSRHSLCSIRFSPGRSGLRATGRSGASVRARARS